jgi:CheY-like chemotaxis protein
VLVIDDNAENRDVLGAFLRAVGFVVRDADGGQSGLEAIAAERPDLLLLDLRMPGMDGLDVLGRLRQVPGCEDLPVIMVSASVLRDEEQTALDAGAAAFIRKPVDEAILFATIGRILDVDYIYTGDLEIVNPTGELDDFDEVSSSGLSLSLCTALREAADGGDILAITSLIEEAEDTNQGIANSLREMAAAYDYEGILEFLGGTDT